MHGCNLLMARKPTLRSAKTKLDNLLRYLIKERSDWTCENCGFKSDDPYLMQWSHHLSCKYLSIRWNPHNACNHCATCHERFTGDPVAHRNEIIKLIGEGQYQILRQKIEICKAPKLFERIEMIEHYENETKLMIAKRKDGVTGYLEFLAY